MKREGNKMIICAASDNICFNMVNKVVMLDIWCIRTRDFFLVRIFITDSNCM